MAVLGSVLALTLSACGGSEVDTSSQESLAEGLSSALADGDGEAVCANVEGEEDWVRLEEGSDEWDDCVAEVEKAGLDEEALGEARFDDAYVRFNGVSVLTHEDPDGQWIINDLDIG